MKGVGTDEQALIDVTYQLNFIERAQMIKIYQSMFGLDLRNDISKDTSFNFKKILVGAYTQRYQFWAQCVNEMIEGGLSTDSKRLIYIVLLMSDYDYMKVNQAYELLYHKNMYAEISKNITTNDWGRLLKGWLAHTRTLQMAPQAAAEMLHNAAKGIRTDEEKFIQVLCGVSPQMYAQINYCYQQQYNVTLEKTIKKAFSSKAEQAYLLAHRYLLSPIEAIASVLNQCVKGLGTDDKTLVMITVLFSDYYRQDPIIQAYQRCGYGDLRKDLKGDLSGWYEKIVVSMWCGK